MDFWTSARVTFYGATECLRLGHIYPAEVELHISRCQSILESLKSLRLLNSPDAENRPDAQNWPDAQNPPDAQSPPDAQNPPDARNPPDAVNPPDAQNWPDAQNPPDPQDPQDTGNPPDADAENLDNWFGIFEGILQQLQLIADTITREEVNANNSGLS